MKSKVIKSILFSTIGALSASAVTPMILTSCGKKKQQIIPAQSIELKQNTLFLTPRDSYKLIATVLPENATNKNVTWSSSNQSVATVDQSGNVTADIPGTATVTVTTEDGGYTATCLVTVTEKVVPVASVSLNWDKLELFEGWTAKLTATVLPEDATNKNVTWTSSNESIATVDQIGNIKALSEGTATVTVTTDDGGYTDICLVTVTKKIIPVNSVALDKNKLEMVEGQTVQLIATVLPKNATNKSIAWKSSDESVATVDQNGNVIAKAIGNATVKVTTEDGGYTSACLVTISEKIIPVASVSLDNDRLNLIEGGTAKLTATVLPEDATNKNVTWSSSDPSIASVDQSGNIKVFNEGTATVTVTTEDGNKSSACLVTVSTNPTPVVVGMDYGTWGNIKVKYKLLSNYECRLLTKFNGEDSENGYVEGAGVLRIPDHVVYNGENYYVKRIPSEWSNGENDVYGIEFDNVSHLKEICDYAFKGTNALDNYHNNTLVFPEGVEYIGTEAFYNVDRGSGLMIYNIIFPSTLNAINVRAFANAGRFGNADNKAKITFKGNFNPGNIGDKAFSPYLRKNDVGYIYAPTIEIATNIANHIRVCYPDDFEIGDEYLIPKVLGS